MGCSSSATSAEPASTSFDARYVLGDKLGQGAFGTVRAISRRGGSDQPRLGRLAVKIVSVDDDEKKATTKEHRLCLVHNEYEAWRSVPAHPNVVRVMELIIQDQAETSVAYLVMERAGKSLKSQLASLASNYQACSLVLRAMLSAANHVHSCGIVHRDCKFDNFLFPEQGNSFEVKLCDFGVAATLPSSGFFTSVTGSAPFMAPEVVTGRQYAYPVDVWSIGVCWYHMLYGHYPYMPAAGESGAKGFKVAIAKGIQPSYHSNSGQGPPASAVSIAKWLLTRKIKDRASAQEALSFLNSELAAQSAYAEKRQKGLLNDSLSTAADGSEDSSMISGEETPLEGNATMV